MRKKKISINKELKKYNKLTDTEIDLSISRNHTIMDSLISDTYDMLQYVKKSNLNKPLDQLPIKNKLFLINETRKNIVVQCYIQSIVKTSRLVSPVKYPYGSCIK